MQSHDPTWSPEPQDAPGVRALRRLKTHALKRRSAIGTVQIVAIFLALGLVAALGVSVTAWLGSIQSSGDTSATTANIDRVAKGADTYWIDHAVDSQGRRSIDLVGFCNYANSTFGGPNGLTLRTLTLAGPVHDDDGPQIVASTLGDLVDGVSLPSTVPPGNPANCPDDPDLAAADGNLATATYADIIAGTNVDLVVTAYGAAGQAPARDARATNAGVVSLSDLQAAGLASNQGVWMAQFDWAGTGTPRDVPVGTEEGLVSNNKVLVFGAVAPNGDSFCLIKVFDADDPSKIGDYRVARSGSNAANNPFAVCANGTTTAGAVHNAGWPAAS